MKYAFSCILNFTTTPEKAQSIHKGQPIAVAFEQGDEKKTYTGTVLLRRRHRDGMSYVRVEVKGKV